MPGPIEQGAAQQRRETPFRYERPPLACYANYFEVGHNAFEFLLDAGQVEPLSGDIQLLSRIAVSPVHAKLLAQLLNQSIDQFERAHQEIPDLSAAEGQPDLALTSPHEFERLAMDAPAPASPPSATTVPAAQSWSRGLDVDPEEMGIDSAPYSDDDAAVAVAPAAALALTTADYDRVGRTVPSPAFTAGRAGQTIDRIVIHITDAPTTSSTVNHFSAAGAQASAHYLVGQDGAIVQFVSEADTAWHARGVNSRSIGIEHVAIKQGGVTYPRPNGGTQTFPFMPPTDIQYAESAALVAHLCDKYHLTPNRTTIIGHREADPRTTHASCPDGAWNWDHFMNLVTNRISAAQSLGVSRTLGGDGDTVEIKYRAFIPSPAIKGPPLFPNYHGDGRSFAYSGGTSRGEITFTVDVAPGGAISNLRLVDRHWSPTSGDDSADTPAVPGKPDWWLDLNPGAVATGTATCPTSDDTLRAYFGAPGTTRAIQATIEQAGLVSLYMSGNNPLVPGSPAIDADISVMLRRTSSGGIEAKAVGSHDGFPAHELYVNRQRLIAYDPVAAGNGPTALLPPEDQDVDTRWTNVASASASAQSLGDDDIPLDPGVGGMSIGYDALQMGDLIVSTTHNPASAIIRRGSGAEVNPEAEAARASTERTARDTAQASERTARATRMDGALHTPPAPAAAPSIDTSRLAGGGGSSAAARPAAPSGSGTAAAPASPGAAPAAPAVAPPHA